VSEFTVNEGESVDFVMSYGPSHLHVPRAIDVSLAALEKTQSFWEKWAAACTYEGPYRDAVERSLITLKALTYKPTGGIVAAVTTSLPEQLGGPRNWDYRYCWLRDATFTLLAFMHGGYYQEAKAWQGGCCARLPAVPIRFRSCMALPAALSARTRNNLARRL
jgi:GH15 family glucan-1,4-alpha-glucosidase